MNSVRENILATFATTYASVPDVTVYRSRESAIARSEGDSVVIMPESEQVQKNASFLVMRDLMVAVIVITRAEIPDQAADPILKSGHALLMADPTLDGLCSQIIEHSTEWKLEVADVTAAVITARYMVRYQTAANDLTTTL